MSVIFYSDKKIWLVCFVCFVVNLFAALNPPILPIKTNYQANTKQVPFWKQSRQHKPVNYSKKGLNEEVKKSINQYESTGFQENKGQIVDMDGKLTPFVLFKSQTSGLDMYITEKGLTYVFFRSRKSKRNISPVSDMDTNKVIDWTRVDMFLKGATIKKENIIKEESSSYFKQYFLPHCSNGITNVKNYEKIVIKDIYPNIDWILYNSNKKGFKYDFIVHAGANINNIELVYSSLEPIEISGSGNVIINTKLGKIIENAPVSYFLGEEIKTEFIKTTLEVRKDKSFNSGIKFNFPNHNFTNLESDLIIDPQLVWGTLIGGDNADDIRALETDNLGNIFAFAYSMSTNFPVQNNGAYFQGTLFGGITSDLILMKFNSNMNLIWSTYYGGSNYDNPRAIAIDNNNNVFFTGSTNSTDFPLLNSGTFFQGIHAGGTVDLYIMKFSNNGTRLWATYYGGNDQDEGFGISADNSGNVFLTGYTRSSNFPVQNLAGAFIQPLHAGALFTMDIIILKHYKPSK